MGKCDELKFCKKKRSIKKNYINGIIYGAKNDEGRGKIEAIFGQKSHFPILYSVIYLA